MKIYHGLDNELEQIENKPMWFVFDKESDTFKHYKNRLNGKYVSAKLNIPESQVLDLTAYDTNIDIDEIIAEDILNEFQGYEYEKGIHDIIDELFHSEESYADLIQTTYVINKAIEYYIPECLNTFKALRIKEENTETICVFNPQTLKNIKIN
jgi:hypothetical protein